MVVGLGKTVIACSHILIQTVLKKRRLQEFQEAGKTTAVNVKPTLITFPSAASGV